MGINFFFLRCTDQVDDSYKVRIFLGKMIYSLVADYLTKGEASQLHFDSE